jgi:hypothetical protein
MKYAEVIAHEAESLSPGKQKEVLDFIAFLKMKEHKQTDENKTPGTADEIESFFRSFSVDVSNYKFDRDDANAR